MNSYYKIINRKIENKTKFIIELYDRICYNIR